MATDIEKAIGALFEKKFGQKPKSFVPLDGKTGGSDRKLFRLEGAGGTIIGAANADLKENAAFLAFSRHFRSQGLRVPDIYAADEDAGVYLEEDLGESTLFEYLSAHRDEAGPTHDVIALYREVVRQLPRFQMVAGKTLDYSPCHPRAAFDRQSMLWDLNYFKYYFLRLAKIPFGEGALEDDFARFADYLEGAPADYFLYRDFQSRNIMVKDGQPWFIDYQGGRKGPLQYDIASLLYDAKADLPFALREELLQEYLEAAARLGPLDRAAFKERFPAFVYIRIFQAMGAYGLRGFHERKPIFLLSIPYAIRNLEHLLRTYGFPPGLPELENVVKRLISSAALRAMGKASLELTVRVHSFSYKKGVPQDDSVHGGGYVFDCRALPNPGRYSQYSKLTGKDAAVAGFLKKEPAVDKFLEHAFALVDQSVETYKERNFTDLMVAFGCTGGMHRSVYSAERLAEHLRTRLKVRVEVLHRDAVFAP